MQEYSFSNIDKFSTGGLVTRLTTDVTNVQNAYQMVVRIAVRAPFMLIFSLGAAICIDWQLSVIFLAFIPVLGIGLYLVATHAHPIFERVFKLYDRLRRMRMRSSTPSRRTSIRIFPSLNAFWPSTCH